MKRCRSSKSRLSSVPSDAAGANLGNALAATGGHLEEAIQHLNQGIELQPESASAQNGLGVALARAGRLEDAVVQMDKAVVLAPQAVDYRYNFAGVLAANDSRPRAVVQFEEAARLWNAGTCNSGDACGYLIPTPDAIPEAVSTARRALDLATKRQDDSLVVRMKASPGRSEGLARGGLRLRQRLNEVPRG